MSSTAAEQQERPAAQELRYVRETAVISRRFTRPPIHHYMMQKKAVVTDMPYTPESNIKAYTFLTEKQKTQALIKLGN